MATVEGLKSKVEEIVLEGYNADYIENNIKKENIDEINIFNDLNYDSIRFIQMVVRIEEAFQIEIPDDLLRMEMFSTIDQINGIVEGILSNCDERREYDGTII